MAEVLEVLGMTGEGDLLVHCVAQDADELAVLDRVFHDLARGLPLLRDLGDFRWLLARPCMLRPFHGDGIRRVRHLFLYL